MNLYLIGYRGSGKSSVSPLLAKELDRQCIDTDDLIEQQSGMSIRALFAACGVAEFRRRENEIIQQYPAASDLIVSLGGGAPLSEANRQWFREHGKAVWLSADAETLWNRIYQDQASSDRRPALTEYGGLQEVQQLLGERSPIYAACADFTIDVTQLSPAQAAERIVQWWQKDDVSK